jgi:Lectin C-type domain
VAIFTFAALTLIVVVAVIILFLTPVHYHSSSAATQKPTFEFIHSQLDDLSLCLNRFNISVRNAACLVASPKSYEDAQRACSEHNMSLLEMNSDEEKSLVYTETKKYFGSGGGTRIWVNGKWSDEASAWVSYPKNESFYLTSDHLEKRWNRAEVEGQCLSVESMFRERYHISAVPCTGQHYFYCEY